MGTDTKRRDSVAFHPALPSFRARTLSVSSATVSSTTRSTSWLRSDFAELDADEWCRNMPCKAGARPSSPFEGSISLPLELLLDIFGLEELFLCLFLLFLVTFSTVSLMLLARRISLSLVGCSKFRLAEVVKRSGCPVSHLSRDASWAVITGYCNNQRDTMVKRIVEG